MKRSKNSWNIDRMIAETRMLEMELLLHESDEVHRMLTQAKETRPEAPDPSSSHNNA